MHPRSVLLLAVLFVSLLSPRAYAIPADVIAWWRFDPSRFASAAREDRAGGTPSIVVGGLRAAVAGGVFGDGTPALILEGLLAAGEIGRVEHTICLLDLRAHREHEVGATVIEHCQIVIELKTDRGHSDYLRTLRAIIIDAERAKNPDRDVRGVQSRLSLPGGATGASYRAEHWDDWREISWVSLPGKLVIGIGKDALQRWLKQENNADPSWERHREAVSEGRPKGDVCFEAYFDIHRLEALFPQVFRAGRTPRMRGVLGLSDAAAIMLHARFIEQENGLPPMLGIDLTTKDTEERTIDRRALSESHWPGRELISIRHPPGSYIIASRIEWPDFFRWALDVYSTTIPDAYLPAYRSKEAQWLERNSDQLAQVFERFQAWLVISDVPAPEWAVPGLATILVPGERGADVSDLEPRMGALFAHFADSVLTRRVSGRQLWSLKIDRRGLVQLPVWGLASGRDGPVLIGGWSPSVIEQNRRRIESDRDR
ncbi:MAG: hypothetical protein EA380_10505 [Phycisphaeraceae bacterium]|nr:MAG: hypothetical protein EA380_10505 [Phycisphaeraceae bacterium]